MRVSSLQLRENMQTSEEVAMTKLRPVGENPNARNSLVLTASFVILSEVPGGL
jgi:hypothetical protein